VNLTVVLNSPQDLVNIAGVVRAMKNFELRDLRLVTPVDFEARRIPGIAHGSEDLVERIALFEDLDAALGDRDYIVGMTARQRAAKRNMQRPRAAAADLLNAAREGGAALVLGREDKGLTNDELDRCHRIVTIPTSERNAALNLSHAFTVMAYELYVARCEPEFKRPRRVAPLATHEELEQMFARAEAALEAIEFFKTRNPAAVMRSVREVAHRAPMDAREAGLLKAMCVEVLRFLERKGVQ
jgi:TrmH family RNA methyltransferase